MVVHFFKLCPEYVVHLLDILIDKDLQADDFVVHFVEECLVSRLVDIEHGLL
jgi:hypothetical protein